MVMKILPIRPNVDLTKNKLKSGAKYVERKVNNCVPQKVKEKIPKKVTWNNFPAVAGAVGLLTPIPGGALVLYGLAKLIQIARKKILHKP